MATQMLSIRPRITNKQPIFSEAKASPAYSLRLSSASIHRKKVHGLIRCLGRLIISLPRISGYCNWVKSNDIGQTLSVTKRQISNVGGITRQKVRRLIRELIRSPAVRFNAVPIANVVRMAVLETLLTLRV